MARSPLMSCKGVVAFLYTISLCITILLSNSASAAPFQPSERGLSPVGAPPLTPGLWKRYEGKGRGPVEEDGPDAKDTVDWPSDDDIRKAMSTTNTHVFYSGIGENTDPAYKFASSEEIKGTLLPGSLPKKYLAVKGPDGKKRKATLRADMGDRASGVFAETASGVIYFVGNSQKAPSEKSVWETIEFPTLKKNNKVSKIIWVNYEKWEDRKQLWPATKEGLDAGIISVADLVSGGSTAQFNDWDGYGNDPNVDDSGPTQRFKPGWCGLHFRQYQKNEGPGDQTRYRFDITIKDSRGMSIGGRKLLAVSNGGSEGIFSNLPLVLVVKAGAVDSDPVGFAYGNQAWNTGKDNGNHACSVGAYDNGSRQGDCGFTC